MCAKQTFIQIDPILPKPKDYPMNVDKAIKKAVRTVLTTEVKKQLQDAQQKRVKYWHSRPYFTGQYRVLGDSLVLIMSVSGSELAKNRWKWVSLGTNRRGRRVRAVRAGAMVFKAGYRSKTEPGNKYGIAGNPRRYGDTLVFNKPISIRMSSIKARKFEVHIVKEEQKSITKKIQNAINKAVKDS